MRALTRKADASSFTNTQHAAVSRPSPTPFLPDLYDAQEAPAPSKGFHFDFGNIAPQSPRLQGSCACGGHSGAGLCDKCRRKLQRKPADTQVTNGNGCDDQHYEIEADRVANAVMSTPRIPAGAAAPSIQRLLLQDTGDAGKMTKEVEAVLGTPGRPLQAEAREYFESRFGHDFSRVRVHIDDDAARSVTAHAFTVGEHIVFASDQYRPLTNAGRRLLAHELTHVVQQSRSAPAGGTRTIEAEAHAAGDRAAAGHEVSVSRGAARGTVHRKDAPGGEVRIIPKENGKVAIVLVQGGKVVKGYAEIQPPKGISASEAASQIQIRVTGAEERKVDVILPPNWGRQATNPMAAVQVMDTEALKRQEADALRKAQVEDLRALYRQFLDENEFGHALVFTAATMSDEEVIALRANKPFFEWMQQKRAKRDWPAFEAQARAMGYQDAEGIKEMWRQQRQPQLAAELESESHIHDLQYDTVNALQKNFGKPVLLRWMRKNPAPMEVKTEEGTIKLYAIPLPDGSIATVDEAQFRQLRQAAKGTIETQLNTIQMEKDRYQGYKQEGGKVGEILDAGLGAELKGKDWKDMDAAVKAAREALARGDLDASLSHVSDAEKHGEAARREWDRFTRDREMAGNLIIQGLEYVEKGADVVLAVGTVPLGGWGVVLVTGKGVTQTVALAALQQAGGQHVDWKDVGFDVGVQVATGLVTHGMAKLQALGPKNPIMNIIRESLPGQVATDAVQAVLLDSAMYAAKQAYAASRGRREKFTSEDFFKHLNKFLTDPTQLPLEIVKAQATRLAAAAAKPALDKLPLNRQEAAARKAAEAQVPEIEPPISGGAPERGGTAPPQHSPEGPQPVSGAPGQTAEKSGGTVEVEGGAQGRAPEAPSDAAPQKKSGKALPEDQAAELHDRLKDPKNVRAVEDPKLRAEGYEVEVSTGKRVYRRKKNGSWCRWASPRECGFTIDAADEAAVAKAQEQEGPRPAEPPSEQTHDQHWENTTNYAEAQQYANKKLADVRAKLASDPNYQLFKAGGVEGVRRSRDSANNDKVAKLYVDGDGVVRFSAPEKPRGGGAGSTGDAILSDPNERLYHKKAEDATVAAMAQEHGGAINTNDFTPNFPGLDAISKKEMASTKAYSGGSATERYVHDLQELCGARDTAHKGAKVDQAVDEIARARGAWKKERKELPLPAEYDANPAEYLKDHATLRIPNDHVDAVVKAVAAEVMSPPENPFGYQNYNLKAPIKDANAALEFARSRVKGLGKDYTDLFTPAAAAAAAP
jgi:hypothetical protein